MKNRNRTILFSLLLMLSLVCSWSYSVSADVTYDNTTVFNVDNENYTFPAGGMTFSQVMINESGSWIKFNNTDFNITSSNPINITLSYLNSNIAGASTGDTVLSFNADTTAGTVWFNLTGFKASTTYTLYRDSVVITTYNSNSEGNLSFSNAVWSDHDFDIKEGDQTGTSTDKKIEVRYDSNSAEDVIDTGFDVFSMMTIVAVVMVAVVILAIVASFKR